MANTNDKIERIIIQADETILYALKRMDEIGVKLLILQKSGIFNGLITIGDIQRAIIKNISLNEKLDLIKHDGIHVAKPMDDISEIKQRMISERDECMPVIDENGKIVDVIFWDDLFGEREKVKKLKGIPVIIMAGGKGTRMKPLTNVIPKPLIPVGEKTIAEYIMDSFLDYGCSDFYFSVNYKADLVRYYFNQLNNKEYNIHYFQEQKPLGTAGSLSLLKNIITSTFFVSNCDIIINQDYNEIYDFHKKNQNEITMVSSLKNIFIPYGTVETGINGELLSMREKPEFNYMINTGMYIIESDVLDEIEDDQFLHITTLINKVKDRNGKVGVFPISEKQYSDIGEWEFYRNTLENLNTNH